MFNHKKPTNLEVFRKLFKSQSQEAYSMKKTGVFALILLLVPVCYSALEDTISIEETMDKIESYVKDYSSGKLDAAELIVYTEYAKNRMYETLDKEDEDAFTEAEIRGVFDEKDEVKSEKEGMFMKEQEMRREPLFEKVFPAGDFEVVFMAHPFFRHDRDYYEKKEEEAESYFKVDYDIRPAKSIKSTEELESELRDFIAELKAVVEKDEYSRMEELSEKLGKIKPRIHGIEDCEKLMSSVLQEEKDDFRTEKVYTLKLKERYETQCHQETQCGNVCEPEEFCSDRCDVKEVCEERCDPECHHEESCEEMCVNVTDEYNNTQEECATECSMQEVCSENCWQDCRNEPYCETFCEERDRCFDKCEPVERCEEMLDGEVRIEGVCSYDFSDIHINAYGPELDQYNKINEFRNDNFNCEEQIESLVRVRKAFQDVVDNSFAEWFFEDFLANEPEKIINGEQGFRRVLDVLTRNEEEISNNLHCAEEIGWPAGFETIEIEYKKDNANVEVWEKRIPVEEMQTKYWTTLYKYSFIPGKELMKKLIDYKMSEKEDIGPSAKEVAEIKADEGKMEIVKRLADKYGGSFDIKLELEDEEGSIVKKYLQINEDVAVKMSDQIEGKEDISVNVDFNVLYNFINYVSFTMEGDEIKGPYWVEMRDNGGPGKFFSVLGAISKMWREGVKINPRYALLKLFFNSKTIISLMSESQGDMENYEKEEAAKVTGDAVLEKN